MQVVIDTSSKSRIRWGVKGVDRVVQNITNLLNTFKYEVAYDRTLGLSGRFVDKPLDQAVAEATTEIYELISEREPRVSIEEVQYTGMDDKGNMQFKVVIDFG